MKKMLFAILSVVLIQSQVLALDIIYPTKEYVKINSPSTFIVGSTQPDEKLFINNQEVPVHKSGAFAMPVQLQSGKNEFQVSTGNEIKTYVVERPYYSGISANNRAPQFVQYDCPKYVQIARNGAPIRSTAVQSGINRISHFPKGMELKAVGEIKDMYKVQLAENNYAWAAKSDTTQTNHYYQKAFLYDYRSKETKTDYVYEFAMSKVTPYSITEGEVMTLKIYNVGANDDNIATFKITLNQRLMGYTLAYKGDTLILKIKKEPKLTKRQPLKDVKIVVDAGHGGRELGAVGCCRNYEKDFNLSIAKYLERNLKEMGATVYMTRNYDKFVSLNDRVRYTNEKDAQIFVSIHANSLPDNANPLKRRGSSVFYYYDEAKPLSDAIMGSVKREIPVNTEGVKQASFAVVRNTSAVSVLVETAYVINPDDNALLMDDIFRKKYANAVAQGIKDYVWQGRTRLVWGTRKRAICERIS